MSTAHPATGPLLPPIDEDSAPFFEGCRRGELRVQQCSATGRLIFPPRPMSPFAPHAKPGWTTLSGRGSLWSYVVPHPPLLPWYAERAPYNVILVAVEEDPRVRLAGNLVAGPGAALDSIDPATLRIGEPLRAIFEVLAGDVMIPRWVRAERS
jgi:uncharacterized OB-fold protein